MQYRRADTRGGTYFFTINLEDRKSTLLVDYIDVLRYVLNKVKQQHSFKLDAMVVLPDHIHVMWTLPRGDNNYSTRLGLIKSGFSRQLPIIERVNKSRLDKGERGVWQRRYWEHQIRDERDYENHVNYIHYNPIKHGYVVRTIDWPYSTFHNFVSKGILNCEWGNQIKEMDFGVFGERV